MVKPGEDMPGQPMTSTGVEAKLFTTTSVESKGGASNVTPGENGTLADRINFLFDTVRPPGEVRPHTNAEVARATGLSATHIGYLRSGQRDNPSVESLRVLARFFGVSPTYLLDDDPAVAGHVESQVRLATLLANDKVRVLAMRLLEANPSPQALDAITEMVEQVLRLDGARTAGTARRRRTEPRQGGSADPPPMGAQQG